MRRVVIKEEQSYSKDSQVESSVLPISLATRERRTEGGKAARASTYSVTKYEFSVRASLCITRQQHRLQLGRLASLGAKQEEDSVHYAIRCNHAKTNRDEYGEKKHCRRH